MYETLLGLVSESVLLYLQEDSTIVEWRSVATPTVCVTTVHILDFSFTTAAKDSLGFGVPWVSLTFFLALPDETLIFALILQTLNCWHLVARSQGHKVWRCCTYRVSNGSFLRQERFSKESHKGVPGSLAVKILGHKSDINHTLTRKFLDNVALTPVQYIPSVECSPATFHSNINWKTNVAPVNLCEFLKILNLIHWRSLNYWITNR